MKEKNEKNILEKITFYTGIIALIILIGYLSLEMYKSNGHPPELVVNYYEEQQGEHVRYRVEVENIGEESAESAKIGFDFYKGEEVVAKTELQLDYVPVLSKEVGWIVFPGQTAPADSLVVSSMNYLKP